MTISTTGTQERPATDLGFLLHKHPDRKQAYPTSHGTAHVLYPEATAERCTAALLLEVDPVALVRRGKGKGRGGSPDAALAQYVNDRPYAASSLLAVALSAVFKSALHGVCHARPERAAEPLPLRIQVPALPARGGASLVHKLFAPLGWSKVEAAPVPLDPQFPEWGDSRYVQLVLEGELRLADALRHLYVLLPVLDDAKHYWVSPDEVDKLLRAGEGWLPQHPEQKLITSRYLARRSGLTRQATERLELARLADADGLTVEELDNAVAAETGTEERPAPLAAQRREAILDALRGAGAGRVLVDTGDESSVRSGVDWWLEMTSRGGEGMVVKPLQALARDGKGRLVQPGIKVRGREYLRVIYGPEYTRPEQLEKLRERFLGHKRSLALREYALGLEALDRLAGGEPLWRVHEAVFAVLALESEPVDPRL